MDGFWPAVGTFLGHTWWLWAFLILCPIAVDAWLAWRQKKYEEEIKWAFYEIFIPREILKSPQAMEQVFNQIQQLKNWPGKISEYWWDGEVTLWFSFEIASFGGEIHFYMRVPEVYKDLIEAAVYSFYQDIELEPTEDYMKRYPPTIAELYRDGMSMWGTELRLLKHPAYPIKSYVDFESPDENKQYDPISVFLELLAKLQPGQMAAIQFLCQPVYGPDEEEVEEFRDIVVRLRERKHEAEASAQGPKTKAKFEGGIMPSLEVESQAEDPEQYRLIRRAVLSRTPRETSVIEAIEENLARPMFHVIIRYIYISKTEMYSSHFPRRALWGAFNQFSAEDLNTLKRNKLTQVRASVWQWPSIFPSIRLEYRRQHSYHDFRNREMPPHRFLGHLLMSDTYQLFPKPKWGSYPMYLNTRSLATLFHPPTNMVLTAPHVKRVDSRKGGPPAGLAIFGEEGEVEKFQ